MMREVRQLQNELEEPTSVPSVSPSGNTTPLAWDPQALPQHDDLVSGSQPNHMMATPKTTELSHRVLESIQNHKLQVTMRDLFSLSPSLKEFVRSWLTEAMTQPSRTPTTEELIAATEAIDKHMPIISISISKNIVDDVLLEGGSGVNVITEEERRKLGLLKPSPAPFNLKMANRTMAKPTGLLRDVKIHIHGIPYIVTLTIIDCQTIKSDYSMLLGRPWLRNAKVIHDKFKTMDVAYSTHNEQDKLQLLNLGTANDPKLVKLNANLNPQLTTDATSLFKEYRDVFAFSYEDLRGIPEHIATHRIELDTTISSCHQARYRMNPNYAKAVKEDLEKLLKAGL